MAKKLGKGPENGQKSTAMVPKMTKQEKKHTKMAKSQENAQQERKESPKHGTKTDGLPQPKRKPAYPRLWQSAKHKSLGGSPEKQQKVEKWKSKITIYDTKRSHQEVYHKDEPHRRTEGPPVDAALTKSQKPASGNFFVCEVDSQAPQRVVQCLLAYKLIHHSGWSAKPTRWSTQT